MAMTIQQFVPQQSDPAQAWLNQCLTWEVAQGSRILRTGHHVATVYRPPPQVNHVLHGVLTLLTFGAWFIVWLIAMLIQPKAVVVEIYVLQPGSTQMRVLQGQERILALQS